MINNIQINKLIPHPNNPRKDLGDLTELAESIKKNGVMQNLTAVPTEEPEKYMIIIGHRRMAAAKLAGITELPCAIVEMEEKQQLATMLLENMQRTDLTIYEQAQGFQLMMDLGETVAGIAKKTGFAQSTIYKRTKLLQLNQDEVKKAVLKGATLMDFEKLNQLKNEKTKNEILQYLGTVNFDYNLKAFIRDEQLDEKKKELVKEIMVYATRIEDKEKYEAKFKYKYAKTFYKYNDYKGEHPEDRNEVEYVYVASATSIELYKEKESNNQDSEKSEEEDEKEKIRQEKETERKEKLKEKNKIAYELRFEFIKNVSNATAKKNLSLIVISLFKVLKNMAWFKNEINEFEKYIGIEFVDETDETEEKIVNYLIEHKLSDVGLLWLLFEEVASDNQSYSDRSGRYQEDEELSEMYNLMEYLGYRMSDEEKQLKEGTHELYKEEK